jgi:translation initiation factor IF-3
VPVPRRFDRRPPERDTTRINERIRVPEVRLIDDEGNQIGVLKTADALIFAQERDLDLVEVAPEARPPVCRVLDYSKYKYEQAQKIKQAKKHQQQITVREIKFRPKIAQHDYDTKKHHVERFLRHKDKVKVTIMFRGREVTHPERGTAILDRLAEELSGLGVVEQRPMQEGRNMTMMMAPSKAVLSGRADGEIAHEEEPHTGAHVGDVASAAIVSPAHEGAGAGAATVAAPPEDGSAEAVATVPEDGSAEAVATVPEDGSAEAVATVPEDGSAEAVATVPEATASEDRPAEVVETAPAEGADASADSAVS